jgi:hypothetical protein
MGSVSTVVFGGAVGGDIDIVAGIVCVDSASTALGLSHDRLSSHRAVLPVPLGTAVNKG